MAFKPVSMLRKEVRPLVFVFALVKLALLFIINKWSINNYEANLRTAKKEKTFSTLDECGGEKKSENCIFFSSPSFINFMCPDLAIAFWTFLFVALFPRWGNFLSFLCARRGGSSCCSSPASYTTRNQYFALISDCTFFILRALISSNADPIWAIARLRTTTSWKCN